METPLPNSVVPSDFSYFQSIVEKYRRSVHQLFGPPLDGTIPLTVERLGFALPADLIQFLSEHNGATLFRGALNLRPLEQFTSASIQYPKLILFAEGPRPNDIWAFAPDRDGTHLFGSWHEGEFTPLHSSFSSWLHATLYILDEGVSDLQRQRSIRAEFESNPAFHQLEQVERAMREGDLEKAMFSFAEAYDRWSKWPKALVFYGDCLRMRQESYETMYIQAIEQLSLPTSHPADLPVDVDFLCTKNPSEAYVRALETFLSQRVNDLHGAKELSLVEAAVYTLANHKRKQNQRGQACELLRSFFQRGQEFSFFQACPKARLLLIELEIELGFHDAAEKNAAILEQSSNGFEALFCIGKIAVIRQEPWATSIFEKIILSCKNEKLVAMSLCLQAEGLIYIEEYDQAKACLDQADPILRRFHLNEGLIYSLMLQGDLHRSAQQIGAAERCYQNAFKLAENEQEEELRSRIWLRQTDLLWMIGERQSAKITYRIIADCFRLMELPIREAWVRIRMGRDDPQSLYYARDIFRSLDLAIGVSAADALLGNPASSLSWHLERSQEHARLRARAQRASPPYHRRDADLFERRIGAHRMAVAACNDTIVDALVEEMNRLERKLIAVAALPSNHNLARYIAAADLLASHRSYKAAENFLLMLDRDHTGNHRTQRALMAALSRSRNMILVDGLLKKLKERTPGVALAAEVLGWRREKQAVPALLECLKPKTPLRIRKAAIAALGRIGDKTVIEPLMNCLNMPEVTEVTAVALLLLGEWCGLDEQAQAMAKPSKLTSKTLGEIVGRYGGSSYLLLLLRALDFEGVQALGACVGLGYLGDPRV
ncbi:MAG: HEAT repeat domain-containing protein, partial [Myxococcota bacterium]|nr:HEAT repeat domain-containing protein [Myxococcota bacterium]